MKKKQFISLTIVFLMTLTLLAGCSGSGGQPEATTAVQSSAVSSDAETMIPKKDLNDYEFTLGSPRSEWVDAPINQLQEDMMNTYALIEDLYNCSISAVYFDAEETLLTTALSQEKAADFICARQQEWGPPAVKGYLRPLDTEEMLATGLDISDPDQVDVPYSAMSSLVGHIWCYSMSGPYFTSYFGHGYAFNKRVCADAGYPADKIYASVYDFTWDYEYFKQICRDVSRDTNGDNVNEYEGIVTQDDTEFASDGVEIVFFNESTGRWQAGPSDPRFVTAANFILECAYDSDVMMADRQGMSWNDRRLFFYDGNAAFVNLWSANFGSGSESINMLMSDDYGWIPVPHGPDATGYACLIPDYYGFVIQSTNQDWQNACFIMSEIGQRFTDTDSARALYRAQFRDDESVDILYNVIFPIEKLMANRFSPAMRDALDVIYDSLGAGDPMSTACEKTAAALQSAIDEMFGY